MKFRRLPSLTLGVRRFGGISSFFLSARTSLRPPTCVSSICRPPLRSVVRLSPVIVLAVASWMNFTATLTLTSSSGLSVPLPALLLMQHLSAAHLGRMRKELQRLEVDPPPSDRATAQVDGAGPGVAPSGLPLASHTSLCSLLSALLLLLVALQRGDRLARAPRPDAPHTRTSVRRRRVFRCVCALALSVG